MEHQQATQMDRRAAMLEAFDSMSDDSQMDALFMLQSIARTSPRRTVVALRLVASNSGSDSFGQTPGGC